MGSDALTIIPRSDLTRCFSNCVLTFSHLTDDKKREDLQIKVKRMGGKLKDGLTKKVTHLITLDWTTAKSLYVRKHKLSKVLMEPKWIDAVYNQSGSEILPATHPSFQRFRLPLFQGFTICFSMVPLEKRSLIKQKVERNGGKYAGDFNPSVVTHLVVMAPEGKKYDLSLKYASIKKVSFHWFLDSIQQGVPLMEEDYPPKNYELSESLQNQSKRKSGDMFPNMGDFVSKKAKLNIFNNKQNKKTDTRISLQKQDADVSLAEQKADEFESILKDLGNRQVERPNQALLKPRPNQSQNEKKPQGMLSLTMTKSSQSSEISVSLPVLWEGSSA
ncbi:DNA topoisomerase 2-binding protein 1-A [Tetranychus urticae]|uniref:BRCT domain-containing protein n=1 Tax=Tetranychus urticae TaxID=32264 RepID=T1K585_TETUR|nr:DNA topoisomerase 2-binding protein 1-A [Tetranychus urticae]